MKKDIKFISSIIIKIVVILNMILLLGMALYCFRNSDLNIEYICDECCIYTEEVFTFSKIVLVLQSIVAIIMLAQSRKHEESSKYGYVSGLAGIGILFAIIQGGAFYINPSISTHSANEYAEKMMDTQILVGMIISLVMVVTNIIILISAKMYIRQLNKEYIAELNNNHVLAKLSE